MSRSKVLIISDIDGTLLPHPFEYENSSFDRQAMTSKFSQFCGHPQFWIVTGRRKSGYEKIFTDVNMQPKFAKVTGLEFGSHLFFEGQVVHEPQQNQNLVKMVERFMAASATHEVFAPFVVGKLQYLTGSLNGFIVETKAWLAQTEWSFPKSQKMHLEFEDFYRFLLNELLHDIPDVYLQIFLNRIDFVQRDFVPKAGMWSRLQKHVPQNDLNQYQGWELIVLGDEWYDACMFKDLKQFENKVFSKVTCVSVGKDLPYASQRVRDPQEAQNLVASILGV